MALNNENFEEFECVFSPKDHLNHFVKIPIILKCGHYVCKG